MNSDNGVLVYGLLFLAIIAFNVFKQFLAARAEQRRRQQRQAAADQGLSQPQPQAEPDVLTESDWGRAPEPSPAPPLPLVVQVALKPRPEPVRPQPPMANETTRASNVPARRRARHRLFQSRRALREGIVMITILGPCRTEQPYDQERS